MSARVSHHAGHDLQPRTWTKGAHGLRTIILLTVGGLFLTGCGGVRTATSPTPAAATSSASERVVAASTGRDISSAEMADAAARADVVFFGEQHDDDETHRAELALLAAIGERRGSVILSLEMFERDVQALVDAYLAGRITEDAFRSQSRPWPNYAPDYRPLVELAKSKGWPVIAANVPRRLASMVSRNGLAALDTLNATDRSFVARDIQCPKDQYYANFVEVMGGGHAAAPTATAPPTAMAGMTDLFYQAQCIKDETMAESIVAARTKSGTSAVVVHFTGSFHSDFGLGTASRVMRRVPLLKSVVVSAVPVPDPTAADAKALLKRGQFIVIVRRTKP
jgi:uncharacterized iron-regulated protein